MNNFELGIFNELKVLALMAIDALETATANNPSILSPEETRQYSSQMSDDFDLLRKSLSNKNNKFFRNLHSFVNCHANISKILWLSPSDKKNLKKLLEKIYLQKLKTN